MRRADRTSIFPTEKEFVDLLPKLVYHMDEPVAGPGLFPQYIVSSLAASQGEGVPGRPGRRRDLRWLRALCRRVLRAGAQGRHLRDERGARTQSFARDPSCRTSPRSSSTCRCSSAVLRSGIFEPIEQQYFSLVDRSDGALEAFSDDFRSHYRRDNVFERFQQVFNHPDTRSYYNKMTHFDMQTGAAGAAARGGSRQHGGVARVARAAARSAHRRAGGEHAAGDEVPGRRDEVPVEARHRQGCCRQGPEAQGQDGFPRAAADLGARTRRRNSSATFCSPSARANAACSTWTWSNS